ncbi:MAG: hypothetical protein COY39_00155 [Alphaproteobacteria bacterium CG_4_10_14_0_8_um_filter_37_21]|nr:MAG: hypothetical protein COY39_00155 [Alphaproteobacteria bacterium CG_4_10_14_0_8_um_filter_37_21]
MVKKIGKDEFDYESMVQKSLRSVVRDILKKAIDQDLPGDHHFYIAFSTMHPGVQIPDSLREEYPEDMTIILQHEYWDLAVDDNGFAVSLCFDDAEERICVPFDALISFVDPSVTFGLQFAPIYPETTEKNPPILNEPIEKTTPNTTQESNVVSLDFSKKK